MRKFKPLKFKYNIICPNKNLGYGGNQKIGYYYSIKKNFDYVGENFTYEARSLHYKNKKGSKGIYGTTSKEDLQELKEEGIETEVIPWIKDSIN